MRTTFIETLTALAERDDRIFLVIADLGFSVVEQFEERFPERFINVGIAEANAVSVAAGLALCGRIPFVYSIAPFLTMRAFEQVRVDCAYMNTNVRLVGVGGGVAYGPAGATHHAIEDLAIMRALPNMTVIAPGDPVEVEACLSQCIERRGPVYIRLSKNGEPIISRSDISIGEVNVHTTGDDATILTTGNMFELGAQVSSLLAREGFNVELANMHTIKPIDRDYITMRSLHGAPMFAIEEHNRIGGLGSAVSEILCEVRGRPALRCFAIPDEYSHYVGDQQFIRSKWGLSPETIAAEIRTVLNGERSC